MGVWFFRGLIIDFVFYTRAFFYASFEVILLCFFSFPLCTGMNKSFLFLVPLQNSEAAARLII